VYFVAEEKQSKSVIRFTC